MAQTSYSLVFLNTGLFLSFFRVTSMDWHPRGLEDRYCELGQRALLIHWLPPSTANFSQSTHPLSLEPRDEGWGGKVANLKENLLIWAKACPEL